MSTLKRKSEALSATDANKKTKTNSSITSFFGAPKSTPASSSNGAAAAAPSSPAVKFDKEKWVAGLTPEQKKFLRLEIETMDPSWLALLKDDIASKEFLDLKKFLERETMAGKKVFPPREDVYSWSRHTPFHQVKVVIVGQDPYHNVNQAHGLAFSVRPPTPAPPSLRNMYTALKKDYPSFSPPSRNAGLLTPWADRGVLMINTCLTVRAHEAASHANRGWEKLTQRVIDLVSQKRTRGAVFMAWGTPAGKRVAKVDAKRHLVLKSVHPSPLSAMRGFFDCGHFRKANDWLVDRYGADGEIDWDLNPEGPSRRSTLEHGGGAAAKAVVGVTGDEEKENMGNGNVEEKKGMEKKETEKGEGANSVPEKKSEVVDKPGEDGAKSAAETGKDEKKAGEDEDEEE